MPGFRFPERAIGQPRVEKTNLTEEVQQPEHRVYNAGFREITNHLKELLAEAEAENNLEKVAKINERLEEVNEEDKINYRKFLRHAIYAKAKPHYYYRDLE